MELLSMKKIFAIVTLALLTVTTAYADDSDPSSVQQGAAAYDWNNCMNAKLTDCANDCTTSEDPDCSDKCKSLSKDKCISEGLNPPQQEISQGEVK